MLLAEMDEAELTALREALEAADRDLVRALEARAAAVRRFAAHRASEPGSYFALPSTAEVVQRARGAAEHLPADAMERVFREALGACDAIVAPRKVAALGPEGGFAQVAAERHFGAAAEVSVLESIARVFEDVERGRVAYGVVPFETSSDGAVAETVDALVASEVRICAELTLPCTYDLVSETGNLADVETIYGTAVALAACDATLRRELPRARILDVRSGSYAESLAREDHGAAAVVASPGGHRAPSDSGSNRALRVVRTRVEDRAGVDTRFVVIGQEHPKRTGRDRTVVALMVGDGPGSLYHALKPFADRGINLSRIESRAARGGSWKYVFVLELEGHATERSVVTAIDEVSRASQHLKVLGSFPRPPE